MKLPEVVPLSVGIAVTVLLFASGSDARQPDDWMQFGMHASGVAFEVPPGFEPSSIAEDGQQAQFSNNDGSSLTVIGFQLPKRDFRAKVKAKVDRDESEGWNVTYQRVTRDRASYSGVRGETIRYFRAITICADRAAFFTLDYPRIAKVAFDPIVTKMVRTFREEC